MSRDRPPLMPQKLPGCSYDVEDDSCIMESAAFRTRLLLPDEEGRYEAWVTADAAVGGAGIDDGKLSEMGGHDVGEMFGLPVVPEKW